jgi:hypothetical protein
LAIIFGTVTDILGIVMGAFALFVLNRKKRLIPASIEAAGDGDNV